ncbi:hypothetical protein FQN57_007177 [Myotisia sp. PD_48]|nr:hypothetical protein FQN57_007177 [Myotisia sp. PD_48]
MSEYPQNPPFGAHFPYPQWLPYPPSSHIPAVNHPSNYHPTSPPSLYNPNGATAYSNPRAQFFANGINGYPPLAPDLQQQAYFRPMYSVPHAAPGNFSGLSAYPPQIPVHGQVHTQGVGNPDRREEALETLDKMDVDREEGELSSGDADVEAGTSSSDNEGKHSYQFQKLQGSITRPAVPPSKAGPSRASNIDTSKSLSVKLPSYLFTDSIDGTSQATTETSAPLHHPKDYDTIMKAPTFDNTAGKEDTDRGVQAAENIVAQPNSTLGKSAIQLKALAQGALLNLAPHKIKFDELVKEGVDPSVLRCLYDELGIKVTTITPSKELTNGAMIAGSPTDEKTRNHSPPTNQLPIAKTIIAPELPNPPADQNSVVEVGIPQPSPIREAPITSVKPSSSAVDTKSSKPLERKELIARMLAEKTAKAAPQAAIANAKTAPMTQRLPEKPISLSLSPEAATLTTLHPTNKPSPSESTVQKGDEPRGKEKSKAKTELARLRMEQFKKLGLGKSSVQSPLETPIPSTAPRVTPALTGLPRDIQPPLSHPLPCRPPIPENQLATRIPGLFMTGSESKPVDEPTPTEHPENITNGPLPRVPRKRPRASDFTDDVPEPLIQRRSGSGIHRSTDMEKVIIDISEDEGVSGSDAVRSLEGPGKVVGGPQHLLPQKIVHSPSALPGNSSRIGNSHRSTPISHINTPTKGISAPNDLEQKHMEILDLRQRIAELERRRANKKVANPAQVEQPVESSVESSVEGAQDGRNITIINLQEASDLNDTRRALQENIETLLIESAGSMDSPAPAIDSTEVDSQKQSPFPLVRSISHLSPDMSDDIRQKYLRKKEIESGLPFLEAELLRSEQKLEETRRQENALLTEIAKGKEGKRKLVEELESLGLETEGLSWAEIEAMVKGLEQIIEPEKRLPIAELQSVPVETATDPNHEQQQTAITPNSKLTDTYPTTTHSAIEEDKFAGSEIPPTEIEHLDTNDSHDIIMENGSPGDRLERRGSYFSSSAMDESTDGTEDELENDRKDDRSPSVGVLCETSNTNITPSAESQAESHPNFTPPSVLNPFTPDTTGSAETAPRDPTPSVMSDAYEPPEANIPMSDISEHRSSSVSRSISVEETAVETNGPQLDQEMDTLTLNSQLPSPTEAVTDTKDGQDKSMSTLAHRFSPYKSPLNLFKAYRYHPNYTDNIDGGFRSLTYSHNIDPHKPLCDFEMSGGTCNDRSCHYQHFRDMDLSDDKILVELGSRIEGATEAEQEEYVTGLKQIINDLRRDKVNDLTSLAREISAYRRRFLQDDSRILAL